MTLSNRSSRSASSPHPHVFVPSDLVEETTVPHPAAVKQVALRATDHPIVDAEGPRGLEETLRFIVHRDREAETVRQVDIVIVPHRKQIMAA